MNFGLPDEAIARIQGVLARFPEVERAVIFGSRAKGTHRPGSDIDLTLFGAGLETRRLGEIAETLDDLLLPYTIDLSLFTELKHPDLEAHIERVGRTFYERGSG